MALTKGRVVKPQNPKDGLDLADKVYKKHLADGPNSELKNLVDADWATAGPAIITARKYHDKAEELKGQMEAAYRLRDAAYAPVKAAVDASAAYLKGRYNKNPKKLSEWGFQVNDTPPAKKKS